MNSIRTALFALTFVACALCFTPSQPAQADVDQASVDEVCSRPAVGAPVLEAEELHSVHGVLNADLGIYNERAPNGETRYCYRTPDGHESPTLRVRPGDLVVLHLSNHLVSLDGGAPGAMTSHHHSDATPDSNPCTSGLMSATSTNLHFHGMAIPPTCHQDEVLKTSIQPGDPPFDYRFRVPKNQPPGLYWYHPHIHGFGSVQLTGGASGALIVEGLGRAIPEVNGLPERVFVIRDSSLVNPDAPPSKSEPVVPPPTLDPDGDIANNNTGYGKPARDLSVNFVPVPYPDYTPATLVVKPDQRELWRVLNAAANTYLHLSLLYDTVPQSLAVVAIDGVPVNQSDASLPHVKPVDHLVIPPGSRAEFLVETPALGVKALLITRMVNTGQDGENDPNRALVAIRAATEASEPHALASVKGSPPVKSTLPWVGSVTPTRVRRLYLSERRAVPDDPKSPILFFITEDGKTPKVFDPAAPPDIVVKQGEVEDWIIENRSLELHAFHIHQLHFQLREWYGMEVNEPFLRDTVSVPFFDNHMTAYPSIRVRMDFRDPNIIGTFAYHCHLLEHEDGGMMGTIRVEKSDR